jgi:hypothetical protein
VIVFKVARGHGGARVFYDRKRNKDGSRWRGYHYLAVTVCVYSKGSFWRVIIGPLAICFLERNTKGERKK